MADSKRSFPKLNSDNYNTWSSNMEAYLGTLKVWDIVNKFYTSPSPADPNALTSEERKALLEFSREKGLASGQIWLAVEDD